MRARPPNRRPGTIGAVATQLESSLRITHTELGLLATVTALVGAAATTPLALLADRVKRVPLLAASIVQWSGAYTFLIMLVPLGCAGVILMRARRTHPRDLATAAASEAAAVDDATLDVGERSLADVR